MTWVKRLAIAAAGLALTAVGFFLWACRQLARIQERLEQEGP